MQCREFKEVSESYLSDELLVETNHLVNHHLEHCPDCRADFASRKALRKLVNSAGRNASEFQIDREFNNGLEERLKEEALRSGGWAKLFTSPRVLLPAMAVIVFALGFGVFYLSTGGFSRFSANNSFSTGLAELAHFASGNHKDCALEKLGMWERMSGSDYPEKAAYTEKVLAPLRSGYSDKIEMLSVHDCEYRGKQFTHVVIKSGSNIVSVFFGKTDTLPVRDDAQSGPILTSVDNGLQVASFSNKNKAVLVVSDLLETENLQIARALSYSFGQSS